MRRVCIKCCPPISLSFLFVCRSTAVENRAGFLLGRWLFHLFSFLQVCSICIIKCVEIVDRLFIGLFLFFAFIIPFNYAETLAASCLVISASQGQFMPLLPSVFQLLCSETALSHMVETKVEHVG